MFAISPITTTPIALSVPASALAAPSSDLVSTRLTSIAVAAPLSNASVSNDSRKTASIVPPATIVPQATVETATASDSAEATPAANNSSSAFLAQLISQNSDETQDNQIALANSFTHFAPAPTYTTFIGFSVVKFRPSDAGLPSPYATTPTDTPPSESQNTVPQTSAATEYTAYNTTQSRNQSNLAPQAPQLIVAG